MTDDKLYTSLSANTIMAILTNHVQRTRIIKSLTDKDYSLDTEGDFCFEKHQSPIAFLFRTTLTQMITLHELLILLGSNHLLCHLTVSSVTITYLDVLCITDHCFARSQFNHVESPSKVCRSTLLDNSRHIHV